MSLAIKTPDPKTPDPKSRQLESGKLIRKKKGRHYDASPKFW
jgi:hypothetical protein